MNGAATDPVHLRVALGDDYEVLDHLGQGAYGTVWKGIQKSTGQPVAIKLQRLGPDQNAEQRAARIARFERETRLCATLNHPHIVRIIDQRRFEDCLVMVFEYVPGATLTDFLIRRRALPPLEAVFLMAQVLDAMDAAHARGIVHRDLKPDNIMVVTSGAQPYVKVLDFGIGAYLTDAMASVSVLTRSQEILGTPSYAAPEQLRGEAATSRSDIYAWGLVLLECLTGRRVMDGATMAQVFHRQLSDVDVPLPAALAMHPLGDLLRRALAKSPRNRAADAGRLCAELRRVRLTDLVGAIGGEPTARPARTAAADADPGHQPGERRQATVLCCSLGVQAADARAADVETLDTVERDQLSLCADVVARFGGHVVGRLGNRLVAVFGVPTASDSDARRACRAALELRGQVEARRGILSVQRGIDLELRVGVHTDIVIVDADGAPSGPAFNVAARIESLAPAGAALVSETTRGLLYKQLRFQPFALPPGVPSPLPLYALPAHVPLASPDVVDGGDPRSPLVGRAAELQALLEHWMAARAGAGCVVLLRGPPGIGKSRLVAEIKDRAQQAGAASFECQCLPEDTNSALHPALALVRRHFELDRGEPGDGLAQLQRAVVSGGADPTTAMPVLCAWLGYGLPPGFSPLALSGDKQRQILLDVLARLFCSSADQARLVVLEDMHWADPTTRELVGRMTELAATAPVLVVLTARPDAALDTGNLRVIDLHHLDREAVSHLANANAGETGLSAATLAEIVERTDGVPLYVEELTRALRRAPSGSGAQRVVPASLRDLLSGQLDRLGPAKDTAQLAAAIGRDFELELLDAVSIRGTDAVQADLDQLVAADMLRQEASLAGARYVFRHALIREAAADSMLTAQRRAAHHRIAGALEDRGKAGGTGAGAAQPARLAWHFEQAGVASKAIDYRLMAGQQSAQASAHQEALENLYAGLALLPEVSDPAQRNALEIDLRNLLGGVLLATRGMGADVVVDCFTRSWELVQVATASPAQMFRALHGLWMFRNARADYAGALEIGRRLLELAAQQGDPEFHLAAFHCAGQTALLVGDFKGAIDNSQACDRWYDPALQREQVVRYGSDPWLTALSFECIARALTGSIGKARRQLVTIQERSDALGVPALRAGMLGQIAWVELLLGGLGPEADAERARCLDLAGQATRIANELGFPFFEAYGRLLLAMVGTLSGDPAAVVGLEQSIGLWRMLCIGAFRSWQLAFLAQGRAARGEYPAALASAREALEHCERTGENYGLSESHRVLALVLGAPGNEDRDWPGAVAAYGRALDVARGQGAHWLALRAAFSFAGNAAADHPADAGRAREALATELAWFHDNGEGAATPLVLASERLLAAARPAPTLTSSTAANPR